MWTPSQSQTIKLERTLSQASRQIQGLFQRASNDVSYQLLGWDSIETMISMAKLLYVFRVLTATTYPTCQSVLGGGPRVVVSTAAFHARVRCSVPGLGGLKETKMFLPHPRVKVSIVGSLRDREVVCSASDHQGSNFESCVWRTVSSQSSHHPQEVLLAQFSLYVPKGGLKPDSFHLCCSTV